MLTPTGEGELRDNNVAAELQGKPCMVDTEVFIP